MLNYKTFIQTNIRPYVENVRPMRKNIQPDDFRYNRTLKCPFLLRYERIGDFVFFVNCILLRESFLLF